MILPKVGITLGDPGGIGPEVVVKALGGKFRLPKAEYIIFGSSPVLMDEEKALGLRLPLQSSSRRESSGRRIMSVREVPSSLRGRRRAPSAENGRASFRYFEAAVEEARKGLLQAVVTGPISKKSWDLAGVPWRGHTEYLSRYYPDVIMAFWSKKIKVALLSHHLSLRQALAKVKRTNLERFFLTLQRSLATMRPGRFELLVAGLNPHAGEAGLLGREEIDEIIPAIREVRRQGIKISGPYPPDVVFRSALGQEDRVVIALYHDQGLIPFKLEAFDTGVNMSLGLPFARTSPDHGTAFDIAGKNLASPRSLLEAIRLAVALAPRP